jgi:hypothetical protein
LEEGMINGLTREGVEKWTMRGSEEKEGVGGWWCKGVRSWGESPPRLWWPCYSWPPQ